jgi:hypothetical protein
MRSDAGRVKRVKPLPTLVIPPVFDGFDQIRVSGLRVEHEPTAASKVFRGGTSVGACGPSSAMIFYLHIFTRLRDLLLLQLTSRGQLERFFRGCRYFANRFMQFYL